MFRFDRYLSLRRPGYRPESAYDLGDRFRKAVKRRPACLGINSDLHFTLNDLWHVTKDLIADFENGREPEGLDPSDYRAAKRYLTFLERLGAVREVEEHHVA